jgi:hypothetical protein
MATFLVVDDPLMIALVGSSAVKTGTVAVLLTVIVSDVVCVRVTEVVWPGATIVSVAQI